jgi:hypothetical protein
MRMTASQLLNLLAEALGPDLCKQFVIPEVVSLAEDPVFRVRKSTALNFHNICKVGGEHELLERLMPAFVRLSKDDMYRVRRACAESLSEISKNVSEDVRLGVLVEIFLRLTHDPSKLVKQSVLQQAGMFVATLPARAVNENILNQYCSMISNPTGDASVDNDLKYICAFSFPAVFQVIGPARWHEVREVYHILAQSRSTNIKQTLAHSLHEVARILAEGAVVEEELVPVFEEMVQDVEIVQMGVIKHLAKFLAMLPEPCRVSYLPLLHDILHSTNPFNWRLRRYLAHQLPDLVLLPPKQDLFRTLFPTVMILLQDPVASVRLVTFHGVTALLNNLYKLIELEVTASGDSDLAISYQQNVEDVIAAINSFATGEKFQLRQLWLELCSQLLRDLPRDVFEHNFIEGILSLTCDTVTNVRIALSVFLTSWGEGCLAPHELAPESSSNTLTPTPTPTADAGAGAGAEGKQPSNWHWLLRRADIKVCCERLSRDDRDVFLNLCKLAPLYPDVAFSEMSCRGRKTPPGGTTPISLDASAMTIRPPSLPSPSPSLSLPSPSPSLPSLDVCIDPDPLNSTAISDDTHDTEEQPDADTSIQSADSGIEACITTPTGSKARSGSLSQVHEPIEIDHMQLNRSPSGDREMPVVTGFNATGVCVEHANTIVADEIDMLGEGFEPFPPQRSDFDDTPDYDEDRDVDEAAEIKAVQAAAAAKVAIEEAAAVAAVADVEVEADLVAAVDIVSVAVATDDAVAHTTDTTADAAADAVDAAADSPDTTSEDLGSAEA